MPTAGMLSLYGRNQQSRIAGTKDKGGAGLTECWLVLEKFGRIAAISRASHHWGSFLNTAGVVNKSWCVILRSRERFYIII